MRSLMISALALALICFSAPSLAQSIGGAKPIRIVVPFAPGGSIDTIPRIVAEKLAPILGVPVIVENRPGAGGNIGAEVVFNAPGDGATLLATPMPLMTVNPHLYPKLRFDAQKFSPVTIITRYPAVLLARSSLEQSSVEQLLAFLRKNPGKLSYASQGDGTIGHVAFERLQHEANISAVHVPYKGNGPALADLMAGHVDLMFSDFVAAMPAIQSGRVKLLGVASEKRAPSAPNVQAINEVVPGFVVNSWIGIVSSPGTPAATTARLAGAIAEVLKDQAVSKQLQELHSDPAGDGPKAMQTEIQTASKTWGEVIRRANIKLD